jgi:type IV pilus assembly protein PilQ
VFVTTSPANAENGAPQSKRAATETSETVKSKLSRYATDVKVTELSTDVTEVVATFSEEPVFNARLEAAGRRLVIDVPDADVQGAPATLLDRVGVVGSVMTQAFASKGSKTTRILVNLVEDAKYSVYVEGTALKVKLVPGKPGVLSTRDVPVSKTKAAPVSAGSLNLVDVRFEHDKYEDRVVLELSELPKYKATTDGQRAKLTLYGAQIPTHLERILDVGAFGGVLQSISSYKASGSKSDVIIEVERPDGTQATVEPRGKLLVWSFFKAGAAPSSVTGIASDGGTARKGRTLYVDEAPTGLPEVHSGYESPVERSGSVDQAAAFGPSVLGQQADQRFAGRRIDLDLKDADIHNVLRLLADVGQVNIVTADNVAGTVTIRMRNVPWDQALDVVLQAKGLGMARKANIIRVAPLGDLEKERDMAIARRKQELQLAPLETRLIPVSYADAAEVQERARDLLSSRGSIAVDVRTNVLIARDVAGNLDQIEELIRSLDTQTPQVLVEARIVEATSRYLRDIGIQWGGDASFSSATGNPTGLAFPSSVGIVGGASDQNTPTAGLSPFQNQVTNPNFAVNLPAAVGTGSGGAIGLTFGSINNNLNLGVRLSAAESNGMLRILSSPRVLTLDNREARISQGTLIPFSQVSAQGVQTTFQEAKLQLLVKPHVTSDGSIAMHVKINRDEPDFNQTSARGDPTILKREAETDLLVMDGHTAVIGGIYTRNTGRNLDQVPFFGDIPLLGLLVQHRRSSDTRGELVIFLTPRIVNRAEALGR